MVTDPSTGERVEVRRSARRRRTVSAYRDGDRIVVLVPARLGETVEREWVERMVARVRDRERRRRPGDPELAARAGELSRRYLAGRPVPVSVAWSAAQRRRWGSCTPEDRSIRVSDRLRDAPGWVLDYVLVHELAHLVEPSHSARFWELVATYPGTERARAWLEGWEAGRAARDPP
ncbi:MAG: M48 family metallopeptidase [Kineosporiaceae bacterium]